MSGNFGSKFSYQIEKNDEHFFNKIVYRKNKGRGKSYMPVNSSKLKYFENKVYDMGGFTRWGCDYRTLSCYGDCEIAFASCFRSIVNGTNSPYLRIDCDEINKISNYDINFVLKENHNETTYDFDGLSMPILPDEFNEIVITKNVDKQFDEYFVDVGLMGGKVYRLFRFQFYNRAYTNNGKSDIRSGEIVVYGTCCRLESLYSEFNWYSLIQRLILWHCDDNVKMNLLLLSLNRFYYTRYDFRIDFFIPDENVKPLKSTDIFSKGKDTNEFSVDDDVSKLNKQEFFNRKGIYTGWCAGIRKNKYVFCRQYHKKIDIIRNGDEELYADYHLYDGVIWRLEFEFGSRFLTSRGKIYISSREEILLYDLINEYLGVSIQTGPFSKCYETVPEIPFDLQSNTKKVRQISYVASVSDKVYKSGKDVIGLILQSLITKKGYDEIDIQRIIDKFDKSSLSFNKGLPKNDNISLDDFNIQDIDVS